MKGFGSDNHAGIHPAILKKMIESNDDHQPSYGTDSHSQLAIDFFKKHFGPHTDVHFVYNGTAANVLCLRSAVKNYESFLKRMEPLIEIYKSNNYNYAKHAFEK